jgi:VanZ family protein
MALTVWTVALLTKVPHESAKQVLGSDWGVFVFGKTLHVCAYAGLAVLGGTAAAFGRKWVWVLPALVLHGGLTEFFQQFVGGRTGRIEDVGLDSIGISLGGLIAWGLRSISPPDSAEPSNPV